MKIERVVKGMLALLVGCLLNYLGDRLLGVSIELWYGFETFSFVWVLDMFLVPFVVGWVTAIIFGMGGKWLSYFPPLIVRLLAYYGWLHSAMPPGAEMLPMGFWGFFVILCIEASAFGGIFGEIIIKGTYGRSNQTLLYKSRTAANDEGDS